MLYEVCYCALSSIFLLLKPHTVAWPVGLGACLHTRHARRRRRALAGARALILSTSHRSKHIFRLASTLPLRLA